MKKSLILIIGMLIGIGLTVGWQFRISTPESFETNGTIESSYDALIESLIKSGEFVQSHEYYSSDREIESISNDCGFPFIKSIMSCAYSGPASS